MASHVVVIATDLRRTTVKVTPNTYLADVLQEACKKLNLPADKYLVKHHQKQVDLSVPFRTSGLIQGAKLELVQKSKSPSVIQVALQIPQPEARDIPGGRLIQKFPSDLTVWQVLRQFESGKASNGKNINITARGVAQTTSGADSGSGQLYYEMPVLNIMGRELSSFQDFQKTLSQLGYNSGSVLIRFNFRKTDKTLFDAMAEISEFFKETGQESEAPKSAPEPTEQKQKQKQDEAAETGDTPMPDAQSEPAAAPVEEQGKPATEDHSPVITAPTDQETTGGDPAQPKDSLEPVNVFLAPSGPTPAAALAPSSESDFTPTVAHAQLHQARLLEHSRNKRLLSDQELDEKAAAEAAKLAAVKSVLVKVRFPDNTSSDWQIGPAETGRFLYDAVRHVMAAEGQPFRLVLPGTKAVVIKDSDEVSNTLIKEYKFAGRILLNLVWDDTVPAATRKKPFLKSHVAQTGQQVKVPEPPVEAEDEPTPAVASPQPAKDEGSGDKSGKKIPKWLKLGRK